MKKIIMTIMAAVATMACMAQTGTWSGDLSVQGMKLQLVFRIGESEGTIDSPAQGARGIKLTVERPTGDSIVMKIPTINGQYQGRLAGDEITGTFTQHGTTFPLTLKPGEKIANRPQTPKLPYPYATEEVEFKNGDAILRGTLTLPEGCNRKTPVLLMVTGSGFQNRDEEILEHKPFAVIADALARQGIATLRYDDRGFGESKGNTATCTTEDLKNDAAAGIDLLRERFESVGVIGHSEGGTIGLMLASERKTDFVVSLAGMVISGKETLVWQNRTMLPYEGFSEAEVEAYCEILNEAFDARVAGQNVPSIDNRDLPAMLKQDYKSTMLQLMYPYLRYFMTLDARKFIGNITCPVLALNGTKDMQVEYKANLEALRSGLPSAKTVAVEGLNHMFQHCQTGLTKEYQQIEETIAPEVLETIINWIRNER
ncbi:alpha/beta hydrolase [Prevotella sp. FD3004]|uniref:alpha/beta hydrolase n=1 Tax=Prevotella sp. FD3004 TaxID=1408309 RepID=UPI000569DB26|nr:alpha/beta fold hydrolase [Prevotella sp. FD3004]